MAKDLNRHIFKENICMAKKHVKGSSALLAIREVRKVQIKTSMRKHYKPIRIVKTKKTDHTKGR